MQHGHGYEKWVDGSSYLGGYHEGQKEGIGLYKWNDGSDYEGEWHQNKINGVVIVHSLHSLGCLHLVRW